MIGRRPKSRYPRLVTLQCGGCLAEMVICAAGPAHQENQFEAAVRRHRKESPVCDDGAVCRITRTQKIDDVEYELQQMTTDGESDD